MTELDQLKDLLRDAREREIYMKGLIVPSGKELTLTAVIDYLDGKPGALKGLAGAGQRNKGGD